jgi:hypothetical protein
MKKRSKKLALHRETLAELDRLNLKEAAGGATLNTCPSYTCYPVNCDFSNRNTCTTCQLTCTTNLC